MTHTMYEVHLHDEAPLLGQGRRWVKVKSIGWKWVVLVHPHKKRTTKLRRSVWDTLNAKEITPKPKRRRKKRSGDPGPVLLQKLMDEAFRKPTHGEPIPLTELNKYF